MLALLFHTNRRLLGEVLFEKGAFCQCMLTEDGHAVLEHLLEQWQTQGVPLQEWLEQQQKTILSESRIPLRSEQCAHAMRSWARTQHLAFIELGRHQRELYQQLSRYAFTPEEQFVLIQAMCRTLPAQMGQWDIFFKELEQKPGAKTSPSSKKQIVVKVKK